MQSAASPTPVAALSSELATVQSIRINREVDGFARRIATALQAAVPGLTVTTIEPTDVPAQEEDASLDFQFACRCDDKRKATLYVTEAVLYTRPVAFGWAEPARVLFYWNQQGAAASRQ